MVLEMMIHTQSLLEDCLFFIMALVICWMTSLLPVGLLTSYYSWPILDCPQGIYCNWSEVYELYYKCYIFLYLRSICKHVCHCVWIFFFFLLAHFFFFFKFVYNLFTSEKKENEMCILCIIGFATSWKWCNDDLTISLYLFLSAGGEIIHSHYHKIFFVKV